MSTTAAMRTPSKVQSLRTPESDAAEKSGIRDGLILISVLHGNAAIFVNDEDPGLLQDIDEWAGRVAPFGDP